MVEYKGFFLSTLSVTMFNLRVRRNFASLVISCYLFTIGFMVTFLFTLFTAWTLFSFHGLPAQKFLVIHGLIMCIILVQKFISIFILLSLFIAILRMVDFIFTSYDFEFQSKYFMTKPLLELSCFMGLFFREKQKSVVSF